MSCNIELREKLRPYGRLSITTVGITWIIKCGADTVTNINLSDGLTEMLSIKQGHQSSPADAQEGSDNV